MEEKLILRAAIKYRNWMLKEATQSPSDRRRIIFNNINAAMSKVEEMKKWGVRFFHGTSRHIQTDVYNDIATTMMPDLETDVINNVRAATSLMRITAKRNGVTPLTLKEAIEEIRVIANAWEDVDYRSGVLFVLIHGVILADDDEEVDLGSFKMSLDLEDILGDYGLKIVPITCVESCRGYTHPHVSGSRLCTGDGGLPMEQALYQGRLEDYFRVVESVLRTYNGESPHEALSQWYDPDHEGEFYCEYCEEWRSDEDSCYCEGCQTDHCTYCENGGGCCADCGEWKCGECSTGCHGCDETVCNGCAKSCSDCRSSFCSKCLDTCTVCEHYYCGSCLQACTHCGDPTCDDCTVTCGCCENNCCSYCVEEACEECKKDICKGCEATCSECDKNICTYCADNACEHCGTSMCQSCVNEHNCLLEGVTNG